MVHSLNFSFLVFFILQRDINGVKHLNWSKFIADELHKALLKRKPTRGCLLFYNVSDDAFLLPSLLSFCFWFCLCLPWRMYFSYQLLYIHGIDLSGPGIVLPDGPFPINVWTKKLITLVLNKDVQADKFSFGKLPVIYIYVLSSHTTCNCIFFSLSFRCYFDLSLHFFPVEAWV